jgi:hypothetical protein
VPLLDTVGRTCTFRGLPSRPVACAGGQCRCSGGYASQDGGVGPAPARVGVAALAPSERRPAQLPFWTQAAGAAKRSGAAPRPGNEVFALRSLTGTGQCPVAVSGTALQLLGACRTKPGGGHALASGYKRHARWQTLPDREGRTKPTLTQGMVCWIDGRVKPSWRTAWSVGPTERVRRPAPWLWLVAGRSDPLRVLRIQGKALGTTRRQVLSSLDCLFLDQ